MSAPVRKLRGGGSALPYAFTFLSLMVACDGEIGTRGADRFAYHLWGNYYLAKPILMDSSDLQDGKKYPLLVYLHGSGAADLADLGYLDFYAKIAQRDLAQPLPGGYQDSYPSFVLIPRVRREWNIANLIALIAKVKTEYPVDERRIYLIGFSMGGSASFELANEYFKKGLGSIAGIIRIAGESQIQLEPKISERCGLWLHVGLLDAPSRVVAVKKSFQDRQGLYPQAKARVSEHVIYPTLGGDSLRAETTSLSIDDREIAKMTIYPELDHEIQALPFHRPDVLYWLFSQSDPVR